VAGKGVHCVRSHSVRSRQVITGNKIEGFASVGVALCNGICSTKRQRQRHVATDPLDQEIRNATGQQDPLATWLSAEVVPSASAGNSVVGWKRGLYYGVVTTLAQSSRSFD
jgi:hypothetical protein